MELPKNLHDCYFFYYSTCNKGNACEYRHEPAALGHEETCKLWVEKSCFNRQCPLRHMKIERKRNQTPCYWEDRGGCRKLHCVFQHKNRAALPNLTAGAATAATAMQVPAAARKPNVPIQMSPVVVDYRLVQQIL
ncbi:zinc finger CCCH domain-containing protein 11B-like [Culicoides brevitarsis]|uniref:zinc finger CCCH domain-containing protein 11B-like n=1 Tax=Culicoides brevitarsis TaxID=469753 RepID=UPI00307B2C76